MSSENIRYDMFGFPRLNYESIGRKAFFVQPLPDGMLPDYDWNPPDGSLPIIDKKEHQDEDDK